jgi:hypothetical protein
LAATLTRPGLENLLWVRDDVLVHWHFEAVHVIRVSDTGIDVKTIECEDVQVLVASPTGQELLVVDGADGAQARIVTLTTLKSRPLRKLAKFMMASWSEAGIALWNQADGKAGRAELLSPNGDVLIQFPTPRDELVWAVGTIDGALAAIVDNQTLISKRADDAKHTTVELPDGVDVNPAEIRGDLGLVVLCSDVYTVPHLNRCGTFPSESWLTTILSHDGTRALLTDPDRAELEVVPVPKANDTTNVSATPRPGFDERVWGFVVHGVVVELADDRARKAAALFDDVAAVLGTQVVAVIDGSSSADDGECFDRVVVGVAAASISGVAKQRAPRTAVELGDPECERARQRFAKLHGDITALLRRHELSQDGEAGLFLVQAGPLAQATLTAKTGSELRHVETDEGERPKKKKVKKVVVAYESEASARVEVKGPMTLTVAYD